MSATEDRVAQAVREIFEFGTAQPAQFSLADIRRRQTRRWTHRAVVVAVAAAILVVFFAPLPHVSLFNRLSQSQNGASPGGSITPTGWVSITLGAGQIAVPSSWKVLYDSPDCPIGKGSEVFVTPTPTACAAPLPGDIPTNAIELYRYVPDKLREYPQVVNGIKVYGTRSGWYDVPSLGIAMAIQGPLGSRVLDTVTRSPQGRSFVVIPLLVSMSEKQARQIVKHVGLYVANVETVASPARRGDVVAQSPVAGLKVARGIGVVLTISSGSRTAAALPPQLPASDGLVNASGLVDVSNGSWPLWQGPGRSPLGNPGTFGLTGGLGQLWLARAAVAHFGSENAVPLPVPLNVAKTISGPVEVTLEILRFSNAASPEWLYYQNESYVRLPQTTVLSIPGVKGGRVIKYDSREVNGGLTEYLFQWADSADWVQVSLLGANMRESQAAAVASDIRA